MIADNANKIQERVGTAKLCAVTKGVPAEQVLEAKAAGVTCFGENHVQEAEKKTRIEAEWHLIGHLQKNKAKRALDAFDVIQSLDSIELAEKLSALGGCECFVQVDTTGDKCGVPPAEVPAFLKSVGQLQDMRVTGLMTIASTEHPANEFRTMQDLFRESGLRWLSMGMSNDYETALRFGSNLVRIGTAIFGRRV